MTPGSAASQTPLLCLMPGLGGSGKLFEALIKALAQTSHGQCESIVIQYRNGETLEDYVDAVMRQLPPDRKISFVAESFSGPIAIALLARTDLDVGPSVLCNTFCRPPFRYFLPMLRPIPATWLKSSGLTMPLLRWVCAGRYFDRSDWQYIVKSIQSTDRHELKRQLLALRNFNVSHLLADIDVPILYLQSTQDRLIHRKFGREITERLRDCVVAEVRGPHLLLQMGGAQSADLIVKHTGCTGSMQ